MIIKTFKAKMGHRSNKTDNTTHENNTAKIGRKSSSLASDSISKKYNNLSKNSNNPKTSNPTSNSLSISPNINLNQGD